MASPSVERSPSGESGTEISLPPPPNLVSPLRLGIRAESLKELEETWNPQPHAELVKGKNIEEPGPLPMGEVQVKAQELLREASGEEKAQRSAIWVREGISYLHKEIDGLYVEVKTEVGMNKPIADYCMELLGEARSLILNGHVDDIARAELDIEQVKAKLKRVRESDEAARRHGGRILAWETFWFAIFILSLLNALRIVEWLGWGNLAGIITPQVFISALAWGGLGGVVAGFYSLPWHILRRDYDSQYNIFYFVEPLMGVILGGIMFLILNTGFVALIGEPIGSPRILSLLGERAGLTPYPLYLLACLAGFKQDFAYKVLDDVMRALLRQP